jgi:hypothetical protein
VPPDRVPALATLGGSKFEDKGDGAPLLAAVAKRWDGGVPHSLAGTERPNLSKANSLVAHLRLALGSSVGPSAGDNPDVIDAEFKEVDDDHRKAS